MILYVIATRDIKSNVYGIPMFVPHLGQAIRSFGDECKRKGDQNNVLSNHPEDFELIHLGHYDDTTAVFTNVDGTEDAGTREHKQLACGSNYKD